MYYYIVSATIDEVMGIGPALPGGVTFYGHYDGNDYLVATPEVIVGIETLADAQLNKACRQRGLDIVVVKRWGFN